MLFNVTRLRCVLAATAGASYSLIHFFFSLPPLLHIITAIIMVIIISPKRRVGYLTASVIVFFCCEIFIGGCVTALRELSLLFSKVSIILAAFIMLLAFIGSSIYSVIQYVLKKRLEALSLTAQLWHRGRRSDLMLMVDSGNLVREADTRKRVIFVRAEAIKKSIGDADTLFERERCYVIPIDTASGRGTVMGFIPDKIKFSDKKYNDEEFIVVPDVRGGKYGGYDGIAPLI